MYDLAPLAPDLLPARRNAARTSWSFRSRALKTCTVELAADVRSMAAETAGGLDHDVGAQLIPRQQRTRVILREDLDPPAGDEERSVRCAHRVREAPVDGVEREELRNGVRRRR
jgi:hypothetical protein